jgi:hypothetical protein
MWRSPPVQSFPFTARGIVASEYLPRVVRWQELDFLPLDCAFHAGLTASTPDRKLNRHRTLISFFGFVKGFRENERP